MKRTTRIKKKTKHRLWYLGVLTVLVLVLVIFNLALSPMRNAKKQATQLAQQYAGLKEETAFYHYNRNHTYYTVAGTNDKKQKIYAIVAQNGKKINVYRQNEGISEASAKKITQQTGNVKKITHTALGMHKNKPVWEISYLNSYGNLCYDLLDFKTGKVVKAIQNI